MLIDGDKDISDKKDSDEPEDKNNIVFLVFLLYGIDLILPWNAICSCFDFFLNTMPEYNPLSVYPFAVNALQVFGMLYCIIKNDKEKYNMRISGSFFMIGAFLIAFPFLALIGGGLGFWLLFVAMLPFGWFAGLA
jgi:hypothetical protein